VLSPEKSENIWVKIPIQKWLFYFKQKQAITQTGYFSLNYEPI
jgi:hypothetical protein